MHDNETAHSNISLQWVSEKERGEGWEKCQKRIIIDGVNGVLTQVCFAVLSVATTGTTVTDSSTSDLQRWVAFMILHKDDDDRIF